MRLFGIRDGVLDKYCTWFPGVGDIRVFGVDELFELSFDSLSSVDESDNEQLLTPSLKQHKQHQSQAETPQAGVTQVKNIQHTIGSSQRGQYKQIIAKGPNDVSDLSDTQSDTFSKKAKRKLKKASRATPVPRQSVDSSSESDPSEDVGNRSEDVGNSSDISRWLNNMGNGFSSGSKVQSSDLRPTLPVHSPLTQNATSKSNCDLLDTQKVCMELAHEAATPVVENVPTENSKSNQKLIWDSPHTPGTHIPRLLERRGCMDIFDHNYIWK